MSRRTLCRRISTAAVLLAAAAPFSAGRACPGADAQAASAGKEKVRVKLKLDVRPQVDYFVPSSRVLRDRFDARTRARVDVGLLLLARRGRDELRLSAEHYEYERDDDLLKLVPLALEYRRELSSGFVRPYVGIGPVVTSTNLRLQGRGVDTEPTVVGGSALAGVSVGCNGFVQARYLALPKVRGLSLSGVSTAAGLRF